jgi:hypothetical protein
MERRPDFIEQRYDNTDGQASLSYRGMGSHATLSAKHHVIVPGLGCIRSNSNYRGGSGALIDQKTTLDETGVVPNDVPAQGSDRTVIPSPGRPGL